MKKPQKTILKEIEFNINKVKEQIETLKTLTINKTKNGEYFKTITKKGFEIKNKKRSYLGFETYYNKYCLKYGFDYNAIFFADYKELETNKEKELTRLNNLLKDYEKQKEYTATNYNELVDKINSFFRNLNENEQKLLSKIKQSLYIDLMLF